MAGSYRKVWRKHIFVLLVSAMTQWLQLLFTLLMVIIVWPLLQKYLYRPIPLVAILGLTVVICSIWTVIHLTREAFGPVSVAEGVQEGESISLARRQALLAKFSAPGKKLLAIGITLLVIFLMLALVASAVVRKEALWLFILFYYLILAGWIAIEIVDWYNDQYILTADRIMDITRLPLIYKQHTEAPLAMVQNATTSQHGVGVILDFGNVQVETAGFSRAILFESVWRPKLIQEEIFRQIDALEQATRQREREERVTQTERWFAAYHTLASGIRDIEYDEEVIAGQSMRIRWTVQGPNDKKYRTWLIWDIVSRAGDEDYAYSERPHGKTWYQNGQEIDGKGSGIHHMRGFIAPAGPPAMYFRIVVWFEGELQAHSSPEMTIALRELWEAVGAKY